METSQSLGSGAEKKVNQATSAAHDNIEQLSEAARPAVDRLSSGAHEAVDSFADAATQAAQALEEKTRSLREAQAKFMESASNYVHEHPVASLGVAVATGFVLSRLLSGGNSASQSSASHR